ncbi:hypothetical protein F2P81_007000 [Scophthalmus maximus]|uniref:Uncharacterized protein n=1 Tax=Scophthalmus maximus TaxID=52904 RepID=A0A6A4TFZ6_SCOMX|nr:hypothetical protein F2P81_007000 [Scophthalmus maximus]
MILHCVNHCGAALSSSPNNAVVMLMALPTMTKSALRMIDSQNYIKSEHSFAVSYSHSSLQIEQNKKQSSEFSELTGNNATVLSLRNSISFLKTTNVQLVCSKHIPCGQNVTQSKDGKKPKEISAKIVEFIFLDQQQLCIVQDERFRQLMSYLDPLYNLPCHKYFTDVCLLQLCQTVYAGIDRISPVCIEDALISVPLMQLVIHRGVCSDNHH